MPYCPDTEKIKDRREIDVFSLGITFAFLFNKDEFENLRERELVSLFNNEICLRNDLMDYGRFLGINLKEDKLDELVGLFEHSKIKDCLAKLSFRDSCYLDWHCDENFFKMASIMSDIIVSDYTQENKEQFAVAVEEKCRDYVFGYLKNFAVYNACSANLTQDSMDRIISEMSISDDKKCLLLGMLNVENEKRWNIEKVKFVSDNIEMYSRVRNGILEDFEQDKKNKFSYDINNLDIKKHNLEDLDKILSDNNISPLFKKRMVINEIENLKRRESDKNTKELSLHK
ncbi:MAG: hypothetical protein LBC92_05345 [Rickettsiales bacterium]|jgi:hypothetical protein|nr:hypothetical protein [Rickettsiales bacterium]